MGLVLCVTACSSGGAKQSSPATTSVAAPTTVATTTGSAAHIASAQARAESMCRAAFGARALNAAPGTVNEARSLTAGPESFQGHKDAFRGARPHAVIAWCWLGHPGLYKSYAVTQGFAPVLMGTIGGAVITAPPAAGPPVIP